jgi:putative nucleotidyltransferase with HDIG domain
LSNLETVRFLAQAIEAADPYTRGHCNRVRILSSSLARYAGMRKERIEVLEYGALLHDIGKIGIMATLLNKKGVLTEEEKKKVNMHTIIGENILRTEEFFRPCLNIIRNHHEWYNGSGYPDRFRAEQIEQSARIVSISDAFDAMTSTRPYRKALPIDYALEELIRGKGIQFDPTFVEIFIDKELFSSISSPGAYRIKRPA